MPDGLGGTDGVRGSGWFDETGGSGRSGWFDETGGAGRSQKRESAEVTGGASAGTGVTGPFDGTDGVRESRGMEPSRQADLSGMAQSPHTERGPRELFRLDPRTVLALVVVLNVVMFSAGFTGLDAAARLVFMVIPAILAIGAGRARGALFYAVIVVGALGIEQFFLARSLHGIGVLIVGIAGLIARLAPGLFLAHVALVSIRVGELMASLERAKVPRQIVIPLVIVMRFIPTVREELAAVATAMSARGLTLWKVGPLTWMEYRLIPLMISTVKSGEELTQAALTRGLGRPGPVERISTVGFGAADIAIALLSLLGLGLWLVG